MTLELLHQLDPVRFERQDEATTTSIWHWSASLRKTSV